MNEKSRWFSWIIYRDEIASCEAVTNAIDSGAEVYQHGGLRPHWHCLLFVSRPVTTDRMRIKLGRLGDDTFGAVKNPDATRRYMRGGGKRVTAI